MKYLKIFLIIILILSFSIISCKKDSTTGPGGGLTGTWQVVDAVIGWLLTTNSNQVATNMFDVTGQVTISGAVSATLDFMIIDDSTNPPSFILGDISGSNDNITVFLDGSTGQGMVIAATAGQTFLGDVTFVYNNGNLTITQSTIQDVASAATVTISGTLSYTQTNIPANTPTFLEFVADEDGEGGIGVSTIEFRNDGTATVTNTDEFGTDTENWTYVED